MLLDAIPDLEMTGRPRTPVAGEVPSPIAPPSGCHFHPRCPFADERCRHETPRPLATATGEVSRSEEQPSELQALMRNSYADLCLKKHNINSRYNPSTTQP